jgi:molecular chaperone GrpE
MSDRSKKKEAARRSAGSEVAEEERFEARVDDSAEDGSLDDVASSAGLDTEPEDAVASSPALAQQLQEASSKLDALNDRHLRLAAEFQNYRRRSESEMSETWGRAQGDLVKRFLDVLDDLQRVAALDGDETTNVQAIVDGVDLVERKFLRALKDAGVEAVNPAGQRFDPSTMEAVMTVPAESEQDDDLVHQVFQNGYLLKGSLLRPARVSVKKHG